MTSKTEKQLIEQIIALKEIKPRKEWAVLLKSQILIEKRVEANVINQPEAKSVGILDILSSIFFQRKLAYSFAVVLLMILGAFGFAQNTVPGDLLFPVKKIAEQSQAALTGHTGIKQNVVFLNNRINDLVQVTREGKDNNVSSAINEIKANATELVKDLKDNPTSDSQTLKDIAVGLKTLATVSGTDLTNSPGIEDLYQTVVQQQIGELEKVTLTDGQKVTLEEIKNLYDQEKYTDALEEILLINQQ